MRVIGIDPGPMETAVVEWDRGVVAWAVKVPNAEVLQDIPPSAPGRPLRGVDVVAIEMIASYGMAVGREVFETCVWIGRFIERLTAGFLHPIAVRRITRGEVKLHLCHSTRAKDANVRQALIDKLGAPGTKKSPGPTYGISGDCWSALAIAVTAAETKSKEEP